MLHIFVFSTEIRMTYLASPSTDFCPILNFVNHANSWECDSYTHLRMLLTHFEFSMVILFNFNDDACSIFDIMTITKKQFTRFWLPTDHKLSNVNEILVYYKRCVLRASYLLHTNSATSIIFVTPVLELFDYFRHCTYFPLTKFISYVQYECEFFIFCL